MTRPLKIVVVEDHAALRLATVAVLRQEGHEVTGLACAEDVDERIFHQWVDVFVLDLNLPGADGISIARRQRAARPDVGIIMVTARAGQEALTEGYDSGADIYLNKPVEPAALLAAINALSRRLSGAKKEERFAVDLTSLVLSGPQGQIDLQDAEAQVLATFAQSQDKRLEIWQLMELMGQDDLNKSTLEVRIVRLRKKLHAVGAPQGAIKAIRLRGYQLCVSLFVN